MLVRAANTERSIRSTINSAVSPANAWDIARHNVAGDTASVLVPSGSGRDTTILDHDSTGIPPHNPGGPWNHQLRRTLYAFDTSTISVLPRNAYLGFYTYGWTNGSTQLAIVAVNAGATISLAAAAVAGDYDQLTGFSAGNTMAGNVQDYSLGGLQTTWALTTPNEAFISFQLNDACLSDMLTLGILKLALINFYDYTNVPVTGVGGIPHLYGMQTATAQNATAILQPTLYWNLDNEDRVPNMNNLNKIQL